MTPPASPPVVTERVQWVLEPMGSDGYPTEETLKTIKEWPYAKCIELFEELARVWHFSDYINRDGWEWHVSTAGWSGNEDMIGALQENTMIWMITWVSSRRGGHYVFEIPKCYRPVEEIVS